MTHFFFFFFNVPFYLTIGGNKTFMGRTFGGRGDSNVRRLTLIAEIGHFLTDHEEGSTSYLPLPL